MRIPILSVFLALPLAGCAALVAGGAAGVVASNEMLDNRVVESHLNRDATEVWNTVKQFLADESPELIQYDDQTRVASAKLDGATVTVSVETWDLGKSVMRVSAKKFFSTVNDGDMARIVTDRLTRRIEG
jgi:hypothetical protein